MRKAHKVLTPKGVIPPERIPKGRDLLIFNAGEIATMAVPSIPTKGQGMKDLVLLNDAAVYARDGRVADVGDSKTLQFKYSDAATVIDAEGGLVVPGFIDAHTHVVFAGSREHELEMKLGGASFQDIVASGGGLLSTVTKTRSATIDELVQQSSKRLRGMLNEGTTTVESKSGYGLTVESELKILAAIDLLNEKQSVHLVPTYLGAHAIPPEFEGRADAYVDTIINEALPQVARRTPAKFCDVWVEEGYFSADQGRKIFKESSALGLTPKIHADEFSLCGGAELAAEMGAASADHLIHVSDDGLKALAQTDCVAVLLPAASMASRLPYADARRIISAEVPVALGTDLNPGCWVESMQFIIWLAVHQLRMSPAEALTAATINSAYATGVSRDVGSIEIGKSADFILLDVYKVAQLGYKFGRNLVEIVVKSGNVVVDRRKP